MEIRDGNPLKPNHLGGYTLLELLVVISIVALLAAVALPTSDPGTDDKLELAANRVADVLRSARTQAIRTGNPHGVEIYNDVNRIVASTVNTAGNDAVAVTTLRDPVTRQLLDNTIDTEGPTLGVDVVAPPFSYAFGTDRLTVFSPQGMPFTKNGGTSYRLEDGLIQLELTGRQRVVRVSPVTGRVSVE